MAIGAERAFEPESYEVSGLWIGVWAVVSVIAAAAGGVVCGLVARRGSRAPLGLAGVVLVLGGLTAVGVMMTPASGARRAVDVGMMDAMMKAQQPVWVAVMNPLLGAAGVLAGASVVGMRRRG